MNSNVAQIVSQIDLLKKFYGSIEFLVIPKEAEKKAILSGDISKYVVDYRTEFLSFLRFSNGILEPSKKTRTVNEKFAESYVSLKSFRELLFQSTAVNYILSI